MKLTLALFVLLILIPDARLNATTTREWWKSFCARNLVADDPYQYETLTTDELVWLYFRFPPQEVLKDEMRKRLHWAWTTPEDHEIIEKTLLNEWWIK